ncbi:alpha-L-fucosidase [Labilibacter sediminis]|nr:alpha-L-fucosidase [Labilibacter sediminis]
MKILLSIFAIGITMMACSQKPQKENSDTVKKAYEADWESLKNYTAPEWYEDAKLGFWVHWGVYSVPAFDGDHASEWYGRWMYSQDGQSGKKNRGYKHHLHHLKTYGDPSEFGYKDFIPMFKAEKFNADEWADLCVEGGAKFFTMMAAHHDSFCMWDTKLSKWNSVNMGPKRDLVGEMAKAVRKRGLYYGVSNHTAWNYQFFEHNHKNGYDAKDTAYQDLYGNPDFEGRKPVASKRDLDRWLERTKELCDMYQPDLYYFDWGFRRPYFEPGRKAFGAHYYNKGIEWGGKFGAPEVVLNYKGEHYPAGSAVNDIERGRMSNIGDMIWQTDDCVYGGHTWGYVPNVPIKPTNRIIDELVDIVSKRGVLMLSFAPRADGSFPEEQVKLAKELGAWLKVCGEAIYSTRPWNVFGEGSATNKKLNYNGQATEHNINGVGYCSEDIRFTRNKANTVLYAISLDWPGDKMVITSLASSDLKDLQSVELIGNEKALTWKQTEKGLEIALPEKPSYTHAYPLRLTFKNQIPNGK